MPLRFDYPEAFARLWAAHPVGVKKLAYDAWRKLKLSDEDTLTLEMYLIQRHRDDKRWREGVYVPHLATFLNQRRWEDDYEKVHTARESTSTITESLWQRMGYASEADYYAGRRLH